MAGVVPHVYERDQTRINQAIRDLFAGRSNAVGTVTLTPSASSTVVTSLNIGEDSKIFLMPTTANAATAFGAGNFYISAVASGTFTISHASNAQTDKTFFWVALG